jgi:SAM-dependent methyltransferase
MLTWTPCVVCAGIYTVHLQEIYLQRQNNTAPQIFCMECASFFHISGYKEDARQMGDDAAFLLAHPDPTGPIIVDYLRSVSEVGKVYEAGCGVGNVLADLTGAGFTASGIDPNPVAIRMAQDKGAFVHCGYFSRLDEPVDVIICLDVLEHLERPRDFFTDIVASVKPGGRIIVRVPEVPQQYWPHLRGADTSREYSEADPFRDNSVHIVHFSPQGLRTMGESLGAIYEQDLPGELRVFRTPTGA